MTTAEDRKNYFGELKIHMSEVINAYDKWKPALGPGTPEQLVLTKLIERHDEFQMAYLQSDPVDDKSMERIASAMNTYLDVTVVHIDQLSSTGKTVVGKKETQKVEYADILAARSNLMDLNTKVLQSIKSPPNLALQGATSAPGGANHVSNLFLGTMNCLLTNPSSNPKFVVTQALIDITQQFFDNESFSSNVTYALSDDDINGLTQSWNAVVAVFADSSNAPTSCTSDFITDPVQLESDLFLIHDQLDILYDHLETDVTRTDESILSISI
jgi:hypothetical protein